MVHRRVSVGNSPFSKALTLILISGFIAFLYSLYIIDKTPACPGYELSIYDAYPFYLWILILIILAIGLTISVYTSLRGVNLTLSKYSFILLIFCNLMIITLTIPRGYFINDLTDEVYHLAMIKTIASSGNIPLSDMYPFSHVLVYQLSSITSIYARLISKIINPIFYIIYLFGLYLLALKFNNDQRVCIFTMSFGSILLFTYFNYLFLPTQLFLYLVPMILYIFFRRLDRGLTNFEYSIVFIIYIIPLTFLHPLGTALLIVLFLLFVPAFEILKIFKIRYENENLEYKSSIKRVLLPTIIIVTILFSWFCDFAVFRWSVKRATEWFLHDYGVSAVAIMENQFNTSEMSLLELLALIFQTYGHNILFLLLTLCCITFLIKNFLSKRNYPNIYEIYLVTIFTFLILFYISTLVGSFLSTGRSQRLLNWPLMASTLINGSFIYKLISKESNKNIAMIYIMIIIVLLISSSVIGVFSLYPSPYIKTPNLQVTEMNLVGMEWFFSHKIITDTLIFDEFPQTSYYLINGFDLKNPLIERKYNKVPANLGYNDTSTLAHLIENDTYVIISKKVISAKNLLWPDVGWYTTKDLTKFFNDRAVFRIYFNGEQDIRVIHKKFGA